MLVVDDEPDIAAIIAEALEHDGHKVDVAANGAVALGLLASRPYDLILSDTKMPVLDGEGFTRELRRRFPALINRLIFLTGDVLSPEKQEFLAHTGVPCVMKPCDLSELLQVVRRVLAAR
jgi:CheY-like chemotaxis protein